MRKLLVLLLVLVIGSTPLAARPPEEAVLPEAVVGTLGSFTGLYVGWVIPHWLGVPSAENQTWGRLGAATGMFLGADAGVAVTGSLLGVDGNLRLCIVCGILGILAGFAPAALLAEFAGVELDMVFIPLGSALCSVWGFNMGATSR